MKTLYHLECSYCNKSFQRPSNYKKRKVPFCSHKCASAYQSAIASKTVACMQCSKTFIKPLCEITNNNFCSSSCAASFNNKLRRKSRRSKCEKLLFELMTNEFPDLDVVPNDKVILEGLEVDIAIPSLDFAIEWNGVVHYKPIFGETKYNKIVANDAKKISAAAAKNITLIVVPDLVSTEAHVKESFLKIKPMILDLKTPGGIEPLITEFAAQPRTTRN